MGLYLPNITLDDFRNKVVRVLCGSDGVSVEIQNVYGYCLKECKPIEITTPHGRLVDADEAYDKIAEQEGGNLVDMDCVGIGLEETPTVIDTEE